VDCRQPNRVFGLSLARLGGFNDSTEVVHFRRLMKPFQGLAGFSGILALLHKGKEPVLGSPNLTQSEFSIEECA
jgi:hypothetical protein